ncbi:hypothetical protein HOB10_01730 [Candidatus Parcubacteria bacterium]|jgi:hypothetical protein|nr:hypothetical protein [Candidatus Parcubacteria bacterium]
MNTTSRTIAGTILIALGLYVIFNVVSDKPEDWFWLAIWGTFFVVIGFFIFFNKKEDNIEEIKNNKK